MIAIYCRVMTLNIVCRQPLKGTSIDDAVWVMFGRPYSLKNFSIIFQNHYNNYVVRQYIRHTFRQPTAMVYINPDC